MRKGNIFFKKIIGPIKTDVPDEKWQVKMARRDIMSIVAVVNVSVLSPSIVVARSLQKQGVDFIT